MCEILRSNFEERFKEIEEVIERSSFVAIDAEFTGLTTNDSAVSSLFDDASTRYKKLKKSVSQFVMCQFGLCAFVETPEEPNRYRAFAYNFYLFQPSFGPVDCRFLCQASSFEFLCQYKFDFNKFVYEGVPYLNKQEEAAIHKQHDNQTLHCNVQSYKLGDIDKQIKAEISKVESWLATAKEGDEMILNSDDYFLQYMLLNELKKQSTSKHLSFKAQDMFKIVVIKEVSSNKENVTSEQVTEEEKIFLSVLGFSRIVNILIKLKKPLIGHNLLTDVMLLYDKFINPLPDKYDDFKKALHENFPLVYDSKHLAFKIRRLKILENCTFLDNTNLEELYAALSSHEATFFALHSPSIELADISLRYEQSKCPHEAGYDAYLSGYVFLRAVHICASKSQSSQLSKSIPFSKYIKVLQPYVNHINIARASISYVNLAGDDPPSVRPQWFCVKSRGTSPLSGHEVAKQFIRFGSVDVKIIDQHNALVAVAHHRRVKDVLTLVKKNKKTIVRLYNSFFDSPAMNTIIWSGGVVVTASLCVGTAVLIWKVLQ